MRTYIDIFTELAVTKDEKRAKELREELRAFENVNEKEFESIQKEVQARRGIKNAEERSTIQKVERDNWDEMLSLLRAARNSTKPWLHNTCPYKNIYEYIYERINPSKFEERFGPGSSRKFVDQQLDMIEYGIGRWIEALQKGMYKFLIGGSKYSSYYNKATGGVKIRHEMWSGYHSSETNYIYYTLEEIIERFQSHTGTENFIWLIDVLPFAKTIWGVTRAAHINVERVYLKNNIYYYDSTGNFKSLTEEQRGEIVEKYIVKITRKARYINCE